MHHVFMEMEVLSKPKPSGLSKFAFLITSLCCFRKNKLKKKKNQEEK